jgi:hypothetical protein
MTKRMGYFTGSALDIWCVILSHAGSIRSVVHSCAKTSTIGRIRWGRCLLAVCYGFGSCRCSGIVREGREGGRIVRLCRVTSSDRRHLGNWRWGLR